MTCRPVVWLVVSLILALTLLPALTSAAAQGISTVESQASYSFGQQVTFTLRASSDNEITQVYLFFQASGEERTQSMAVSIQPGHEIDATYVHELRRSPLPPFSTVTYWWRFEDIAGNTLTTEAQRFRYMDNRFQWEQLSADNITVHWVKGHGDPVFGQAALDIAQASVKEINTELRAPMPQSIEVYIYDAQHNLDSAMLLTGQDWVSGQAHPELSVVMVAIPPAEGYTSHMMRYLPHEITHLLVYQAVTPTSYHYVPEWLDEGLATANERLPTPEYAIAIEEARTRGQLLSLEELCVPFSPDRQAAFLAYAQSGSVVKFIREQYGAQGIRALLTAYSDGASCAGGVQQALDTTINGLESAWRTSLEPGGPWQVRIEQVGVWLGLWLLSLLVAVPMVGRHRTRQVKS